MTTKKRIRKFYQFDPAHNPILPLPESIQTQTPTRHHPRLMAQLPTTKRNPNLSKRKRKNQRRRHRREKKMVDDHDGHDRQMALHRPQQRQHRLLPIPSPPPRKRKRRKRRMLLNQSAPRNGRNEKRSPHRPIVRVMDGHKSNYLPINAHQVTITITITIITNQHPHPLLPLKMSPLMEVVDRPNDSCRHCRQTKRTRCLKNRRRRPKLETPTTTTITTTTIVETLLQPPTITTTTRTRTIVLKL
mmetsp:Transcript_26402/g.46934  ORF Transcript_26402/g.46934 Transcript_26402/m.46934 type:complete len:245 (-) Transcript_26402:882-1616(-)